MTTALHKADVDDARAHEQELDQRVENLKENWVQFYARLLDFRDDVVRGLRKYELLKHPTFEAWLVAFCKRHDISRDRTYVTMSAVERLPRPLLLKLGKEKALMASRLVLRGKWNERWEERLMGKTADEARPLVQEACTDVGEGKRRLALTLPRSQVALFEDQAQRFAGLTGEEGSEAFFDFMLGQFTSMTNKQIREEHEGWQEKGKGGDR